MVCSTSLLLAVSGSFSGYYESIITLDLRNSQVQGSWEQDRGTDQLLLFCTMPQAILFQLGLILFSLSAAENPLQIPFAIPVP